MREVKVRIAPSPTGDWHLGNARTALFTYLFARHMGGKFYLRIEDTDQSRLVEGAVERLLKVLEWLGLTPDALPDGRPYFVQSENLSAYQDVATQLVDEGKAYYCFATAEELAEMRADQEAKHLPPRYDNRWGYRDLPLEEAKARVAQGDTAVIRLKMPLDGSISFTDLVSGTITVEAKELDDHVILKSDGFPTYHLAHVVDDHDMEITHVTRGAEWISSTPRHVVLHEHLGWDLPEYAHVPVILGPDKGKLSKRHGAKPVFEYEQDGYLPEALMNFLVLLGWSSGTEQDIFSREELIAAFDFNRVQSSPAVFDVERLNWFNGRYIRSLSSEELRERLMPYLTDVTWQERYSADPERFTKIITALQERLVTLTEFSEHAECFFVLPPYTADLLTSKSVEASELKPALLAARDVLAHISDWSHDTLDTELRQCAEAQGLKAGQLLWPIRVALTGLQASPGVYECLEILGQEESLVRMDHAVSLLESA